jgi:transposase InsO family protein
MPMRTPLPASPEALFRFTVISAVLTRIGQKMRQGRAVAEVAAGPHLDLDGSVRPTTVRTVYRWLNAWRAGGIAALEPAGRPAGPVSEVLSLGLLDFLVDEKKLDPCASLPELVKRARERGIVEQSEAIDRTTVWRAARRLGIETKRRKQPHDGDTRRFAYEHRMQMVLSDGKHFRAGVTRAKRVALFFLDDATRFGLDVVVGTSEDAPLFHRGLYGMTRQHGLFDAVFLDGGPGFIADDTAEIVLQLGALLVIGTAGYAPGHGKIEALNKTAKHAALRTLDGSPDVDPDCRALELRLRHWLREVYNHEPHESLDQQTPWQRWSADDRALRLPEDDTDLRGRFVVRESRRVTNDHTIPVDGVTLEVPKGHAGQTIEIFRHVLDAGRVEMVHADRRVRLYPVDLHRNAVAVRGHRVEPQEIEGPLPPSAADLAFRRDLGSIVDPDGGFTAPDPDEVP